MTPKQLHIALDYDGTYTADPKMWDAFIKLAKYYGHSVVVITMRTPDEAIRSQPDCEVIYTSRKAKQSFYMADIWIDDQPALVANDHWSIRC